NYDLCCKIMIKIFSKTLCIRFLIKVFVVSQSNHKVNKSHFCNFFHLNRSSLKTKTLIKNLMHQVLEQCSNRAYLYLHFATKIVIFDPMWPKIQGQIGPKLVVF